MSVKRYEVTRLQLSGCALQLMFSLEGGEAGLHLHLQSGSSHIRRTGQSCFFVLLAKKSQAAAVKLKDFE